MPEWFAVKKGSRIEVKGYWGDEEKKVEEKRSDATSRVFKARTRAEAEGVALKDRGVRKDLGLDVTRLDALLNKMIEEAEK